MTQLDLFVLVASGALALTLGPLLFGIASLRSEAMPRHLRALPLATGLMGFTWLFFGSSDTGELTFTFMFLRTLFAVGWMLMGYVLWSDPKEISAEASGPKLEEVKA
jgi:hypothetical protein